MTRGTDCDHTLFGSCRISRPHQQPIGGSDSAAQLHMFLGGTAGQSALTVQRSGPDDHDDCRTLARTAAPSQLADRLRRSPLRYRHHGAPIVGGGARQSSAESHEGGTSSPDLPGNEEPSPSGVNKMDHGLSGVGQQTAPLLCPGLVGCQRQIPSMFVHLPSVVGLALAASALTVLAGGSNSIYLAQDAIQTVSRFTGQEADTADIQPGQAASLTLVPQHRFTGRLRGHQADTQH